MSFGIKLLETFLRLIGYHDKYQNRQDHIMAADNLEYQLLLWVLLPKRYNINSTSMPMIVIPHTEYSLFIL